MKYTKTMDDDESSGIGKKTLYGIATYFVSANSKQQTANEEKKSEMEMC